MRYAVVTSRPECAAHAGAEAASGGFLVLAASVALVVFVTLFGNRAARVEVAVQVVVVVALAARHDVR